MEKNIITCSPNTQILFASPSTITHAQKRHTQSWNLAMKNEKSVDRGF